MNILKSNRISIRNIKLSDAEAIFSYRSLPEVAKYQYWEPYTMEKTVQFVEQCKNCDMEKTGVWNGFAIVLNETNELIGDCAIKIEDNVAEIGCNISPKYQGKGFAKEALFHLIAYSFQNREVKQVYGITDSENVASIQLMQLLGMEKQKDFEEKVMCKGAWSIEHKYLVKMEDFSF